MVTKLSELEMRFGGNLTPNGMKDIDYKNQNVHFLRFAGASCPICGHKTWCQVNATGTKIICQRVKQIILPSSLGLSLAWIKYGLPSALFK